MKNNNSQWLKISDWILEETEFNVLHQAKFESILHQANGVIGLRAALEEPYPYQTRGTFLAGVYDRVDDEPCEIPNSADMTAMKILLDGCCFSMQEGSIENYIRRLDLRTGELTRSLIWHSPKALRYELKFRRFVSENRHDCYATRLEITPLDAPAEINIETGIDARMSNSGAQHFADGSKGVLENQYMLLVQRLTESGRIILNASVCNASGHDACKQVLSFSRRQVMANIRAQAGKGACFALEKICRICVSDEKHSAECAEDAVKRLKELSAIGYEGLFGEHLLAMQKFWDENAIDVDSTDVFINASVHYSQHLLRSFMPRENDISIGAKGLSGEGYKGHVFWDVECFLLPYYIYMDPDAAKRLLQYRIHRLDQAQNVARLCGYRGVMFPWESADTGYDETPLYGQVDVLTGKANIIWSGLKEHHITADVALMLWQYICITGDTAILDEGGLRLIVGAAIFWKSRAVWNKDKRQYQILDVVGPDEYSECVDNNAYTNYMAHQVVLLACRLLKEASPEQLRKLENELSERIAVEELQAFADLLYLPKPDENGIIPQDDTFMQGPVIDLKVYRDAQVRQTILYDYSRKDINNMQILKQADLIMLFHLFPELFSRETQLINWRYYEERTVHDSSLSYIIYASVAANLRMKEEALTSFRRALDVDLSLNPHSSNDGIHAAAAGGICMDVIMGFAGIHMHDNGLEISPLLPDEIRAVRIPLAYQGHAMRISISRECIEIEKKDDRPLLIRVYGREYRVCENIRIEKELLPNDESGNL